jgi:lipopolysaccharide biosynthesis glycosyltransferase
VSTQNKPVILYLAHGSNNVYLQTLFSILSLYYHAGMKFEKFSVVLYTDNAEYFNRFFLRTGLLIENLDREHIVEFKGEYDFVHRVKTMVIRDCFHKYKSDVLYMDGDTIFLKEPFELLRKITPSCSVMNSNEYDMHDGGIHELQHWFDLRTAIKATEFSLDDKVFKIPLSTRMWNAGVLGISYDNSYLVEDIISLTDQLYAKCRLFTVEQFITSYVLQTAIDVVSSEDYILHYCYGGEKTLLTYHLRLFFKKNEYKEIGELAQLAFEFSQNLDSLPAVPVIEKRMTILDRAVLRLQLIKEVALTGRLHTKWS